MGVRETQTEKEDAVRGDNRRRENVREEAAEVKSINDKLIVLRLRGKSKMTCQFHPVDAIRENRISGTSWDSGNILN